MNQNHKPVKQNWNWSGHTKNCFFKEQYKYTIWNNDFFFTMLYIGDKFSNIDFNLIIPQFW